MNINFISFSLIFLLMIKGSVGQECPIIPLPNDFEEATGEFTLHNQTAVLAKDSSFKEEASFLSNKILAYTKISTTTQTNAPQQIVLVKNSDDALHEKGAYRLTMESDKILIQAADKEGAFHGVISLLQLIRKGEQSKPQAITISNWDIEDAPSYDWRGFMLDESRHFFGKETVKEILDQMAWLKLNKFHWHLTDVPGWRIESQQYPLLSLVGGIGNHSDSLATAQYYTQKDIREIVRYANQRHIEIIPEIDMPGHATASNRAYPEYSGGGSKEFPDFTFNPGKEKTYGYLTNILKEIAVLFPSKMVHLGGDEVSFGIKGWGNLQEVKELQQKHNLPELKDVEHYFLNRMVDSSLTRFDKVLAWDEAVDASIPQENSIIYWWRHDQPQQLDKALEKGYDVVLMPRIPLYFDFVQDSTHQQGRKWGEDFAPLKKVYNFSTDNLVDSKNKSQVLGMQANLWTETVQSKKRLDFMIYPRITALAETTWTAPENKDYKKFIERLKGQLHLYQKEGIHYFNTTSPQNSPEVTD